MKKLTRKCLHCKTDISKTHLNRKYCSNACNDKIRYKLHGYRQSAEQRKICYENRKKNKGYMEKLRHQCNSRAKIVRDFLATYKLEKGCIDCGYDKHQSA